MLNLLLQVLDRVEANDRYEVVSYAAYPNFDYFVPGPWGDRFAYQYYARRPEEREAQARVRVVDRAGRTLNESSVPSGWSARSFDAKGKRADFRLETSIYPDAGISTAATNIGTPYVDHGFRFVFVDGILAIGDGGRLIRINSDAYDTAVASAPNGRSLLVVDLRRNGFTAHFSDAPDRWTHRSVSFERRTVKGVPGLGLALNSFGEAFLIVRENVGTEEKPKTLDVVWRYDVHSGSLIRVRSFVFGNGASDSNASLAPLRNQLYAPANTHDVVVTLTDRFAWLKPRQ